jgi:uncharacterized protein YecE (DUF72 family)
VSGLPLFHNFDLAQARDLPNNILFGTSSWTYPGWRNLIYFADYRSDAALKKECFHEYSLWPMFRCVGVDSGFYRPLSSKYLNALERMDPQQRIRLVVKVWEDITAPIFPTHPRYGNRGGQNNPYFLNPTVFNEHVAQVYEGRSHRLASLLLQFPHIRRETMGREQFLEHLGNFLTGIPKTLPLAVEIRNPEYLCAQYFNVLAMRGVTHCFNHWTGMPALKEQMKAAALGGGVVAEFFLVRLLTPLGVRYEEAVRQFSPYDTLQQVNADMRRDVVQICKRANQLGKQAIVIVNNRCEGCAPLTIRDLIADCSKEMTLS